MLYRSCRSIARVALLMLLCAMGFNTPGTSTRAETERLVSTDQIRATLESRDPYAVALLLTEVGLLKFEEDVVPFLVDLWEGREDKHPELPWQFVQSNLVRPEIGSVLLTLAKSMVPGARINQDEIHEYAADLLDDSEPFVVKSALSILGVFDDERDVSGILSIARREHTGTFRSTVVTLALMCNTAALRALLELEQAVTAEANRSFIVKTRKEWEEIKTERSLCTR